MTRDDTKKLLLAISLTYPNFKTADLGAVIDVWHSILGTEDAQEIQDAFVTYAKTDTSGFAPSPGILCQMVAKRKTNELTDGEVIGKLTMASRNANYGFEEEFNKLPPLLQKAVGSPSVIRNWGLLESEELNYTFNQLAKTYHRLVEDYKTEQEFIKIGAVQNPQIGAKE